MVVVALLSRPRSDGIAPAVLSPRGASPVRRVRRPRLRLHVRNEPLYWGRRVAVLAVPALLVAIPTITAPAASGAVSAARASTRGIELRAVGVTDGGFLSQEALGKVSFAVPGAAGLDPASISVTVDGRPVETSVEGTTVSWALPSLDEGDHVVRVSAPRPLLLPSLTRTFRFTVDDTPPELTLEDQAGKVQLDSPVVVKGTAEPGSTIAIDGRPIDVVDGRFEVRFDAPPAGASIVATDPAGNVTTRPIVVPVEVPSTRAVHVSGYGWADKRFREPVLAMGERGLIDTVQLDLKEEDGFITYKSSLEYHGSIGAVRGLFDLKAAVDELHARNLRVVGRIVAFRDPVLAAASWKDGQRDRVIQLPDGSPYAGYGGFTNFASPDVRKYNIDIAEEAARLGVDDILYDYVRRPDGPIENMRLPGLTGSPEDGVAGFLTESRARLRPLGVYQGASVYGISVDRPTQIAQDLTKIAPAVDYIAPMVYPSHWNKGEYGVADPNREPYEITKRSLALFQAKVEGTDVKIIPWLQDFSLGVTYGPDEVRAQIQAAADVGIDNWILWDPAVTYTEAGIPPRG